MFKNTKPLLTEYTTLRNFNIKEIPNYRILSVVLSVGYPDERYASTHILIRTTNNISYAYTIYSTSYTLVLMIDWNNGDCQIIGDGTVSDAYGIVRIDGIL